MTFDALRNLSLALAAMTGMVADMIPREDVLKAAAGAGFATATDLADWLVRTLGLPFRDAHHVTGQIVAMAEARSVDLDGLTLADMQTVEPRITQEIFAVLGVENSVRSRTSFGGTAPDNVRGEVARWLNQLEPDGRKS
jgi:argininosuccinate lyase